MFLQPRLAGEDAYYNGDGDNSGRGASHVQNEYHTGPESPNTFFLASDPQSQTPSPAQAYAQSYVQTHKSSSPQQQQQPNTYHDHEGEARQPVNSDSSSRTPPSPVGKSTISQRRLVQRPSQTNHGFKRASTNASGHHSNQNGPAHVHSNHNVASNTLNNPIATTTTNNNNNNNKRGQSLHALPSQTLIHLLQIKQEETRRAKKMLKTALGQLEIEVGRGEVLESRVRELEGRVERDKVEKERGMDVSILKGMLDEQRRRAGGGDEVEGLKLKLSNTERELQRVKEDNRALQVERDDADRALIRARALAREMKEKAILIQAREQGRQEGFEEGLKQGRLIGQNEGSSGEASRRSSNKKSSSSRRTTDPAVPSQASLEAEASIAAYRSIAENEKLRVQLELKAVERELEMERSRMKDVEREKENLEKAAKEEREKIAEKERERAKEREAREAKEREREAREKEREAKEREREAKEREREAKERAREAKEKEREREMRDALQKQVDIERLEREKEKERLEQEKRKMEQEKQEIAKKLAEAEENRVKDKEKFEKQLKKAAAAQPPPPPPLPYLPMAPPPAQKASTSSTESQRPQNRRSSVDSYTSQASTIPFDMLQLPTGDLSVIPEDSSVGRTSPSPSGSAPAPPVPSWITNPPIDYGKVQNNGHGHVVPEITLPALPQKSTSGRPYPPYYPDQHDHLAPVDNGNDRSSLSSYEIVIQPPSPPEFNGDSEPNHSQDNAQNPHHLSPHHSSIPLPQTQPSHQQQSSSGLPTRPNSPNHFMGTIDRNGGGFPPGFIPQSITDSKGRSTPIHSGGGGGGGSAIPTPNNQWSNPVIPPTTPSSPAPIYGNPITLEREKKRDEASSYPDTVAPKPPQSPVANWNAPLARPVFPAAGQEPFRAPTPGAAEGTWGGGGGGAPNNHENRTLKPSFEHSPVSSNRPVIPGQTSSLGSGGGGGGAWGVRPGGMTPGPRNQDLSPVIPSQTLGTRPGSYGGMTPGSRNQELPPFIPGQTLGARSGGFGGGGGGMTPGTRNQELPPGQTLGTRSGGFGGSMTPGPRNQTLSPIIPSQTGGGWGAPGGGGGMTPGPRNQALSPIIPSQTGGGWGAPGGGGMTPGPRNQALSPAIPSRPLSGGGGWNTPTHPAGSFGGGAGTTPGARNQDLPPAAGSPYQPSFPIYGPPTSGGSRSSSPFPTARSSSFADEEGDVDEDPITAQNTRMNAGANFSMDAAPVVVTGGGGKGGKGGKKNGKGSKRR